MPPVIPQPLRASPFSAYLEAVSGCFELKPLAQALRTQGPVIWLDSAREHAVSGRWSVLGSNPWIKLKAAGELIECQTASATHHWRLSPFEALRKILQRYSMPEGPAIPGRMIGLMGYISYEANRWIEKLPPPQAGCDLPEMIWYGMKQVWLVDHLKQQTWLMSLVDPHLPAPIATTQAREALMAMRQSTEPVGKINTALPACLNGPVELRPTTTQQEFERSVETILAHIQAGDIYQANLSQRFTAGFTQDPWPLYEALRAINPSPFACWMSSDELTVASCSPERLVRVQEGWVDTRPIAGTRRRGASQAEDKLQELELLLSEKERAEHIMLVDLARNDLGRVCEAGSVKVNELMGIETYSHVIHIVSDVAGRLRPGVDLVEVIKAVFPGGTITGCPKVRCMELLRALEPVARGLYTGSLGFIGFGATMDLNIAIRTLAIRNRQLSFHVGAGIVADSNPQREYEETLSKAQALMAAIQQVTSGSYAHH